MPISSPYRLGHLGTCSAKLFTDQRGLHTASLPYSPGAGAGDRIAYTAEEEKEENHLDEEGATTQEIKHR